MNTPANGNESTVSQEILIIEDELKIARLLEEFLQAEGFSVHLHADGASAAKVALTRKPTLIILDLMLPGKDGLSVCREIRNLSNVPIIMLTARVDEIDRLLGLELGADDYICKPFSPREVVARVRTILRRTRDYQQAPDPEVLQYRHLRVYPQQFKCLAADTEVDLTPVEFRMLATLMSSPGRVYSREKLMEEAYSDYRVVSDRTIDSHIKNLRRKLTVSSDSTPDLLKSIYGVGYKLE